METDIVSYIVVDEETFNANIIDVDVTQLRFIGKRGFRGEIGLETEEVGGMEYKYGDYLPNRFVNDYGFKIIIEE
tara:strand:- start:295 stop:519 length:225 start_codon:yes stop_codon:yes gene_type:complete